MLTFSLHRYSAARLDGIQEEDFSVWAQILVATRSENPSPAWYYGDESGLSKTLVSNGSTGAFSFARTTKELGAVDEAALSTLANLRCVVAMFKGANRDESRDTFVGWVEVPLAEALRSGRYRAELPLRPPSRWPLAVAVHGKHVEGYGGNLTAAVSASAATRSLLLGGRLLTLPSVHLSGVPPAWQLSADGVEPEALASRVRDPATNPFALVLTLRLPKPTSAVDDDNSSSSTAFASHATRGSEERHVHLGRGELVYEPITSGVTGESVATASAAAEQSTPSTTTAAPTSASATGKGTSAVAASKSEKPAASASAAKETKEAKAAREAAEAEGNRLRLAEAHAQYRWSVSWGKQPSLTFLSSSTIAALTHRSSTPATIPIQAVLRRVRVEAVRADYVDPFLGLAPGLRYLDEDYGSRAELTLDCSALLRPGEVRAEGTAAVLPSAPPSEAERATDAQAAADRSAQWTADYAVVAAAAAVSAVGGSDKGKGGAAAAGKTTAAAAATAAASKGVAPTAQAAKPAPSAKGAPKTSGGGPSNDTSSSLLAPPLPSPPPYALLGTTLTWTASVDRAFRPAVVHAPPERYPSVDAYVALRGAAPSAPPRPDATQRFRDVVKSSVADILRVHAAHFLPRSGAAAAAAGGGGDVLPVSQSHTAASPLSPHQHTADADAYAALVAALRESGALAAIRERVQQCAKDIVQERFAGGGGAGVDENSSDNGAPLLASRLYEYLLGHLHVTLNAMWDSGHVSRASADVSGGGATSTQRWLVDPAPQRASGAGARRRSLDGVPLPRSFNEATTAAAAAVKSTAPAHSSEDAYSGASSEETAAQRWRRMALEAEFGGYRGRAATLHKTRLATAERAAAAGRTAGQYDADAWFEFGAALLRWKTGARAAAALREVVSICPTHVRALAVLAVYELSVGRATEAAALASFAIKAADINALPVLHTLRSLALLAELQSGVASQQQQQQQQQKSHVTTSGGGGKSSRLNDVDSALAERQQQQQKAAAVGAELKRGVSAYSRRLRHAVLGSSSATTSSVSSAPVEAEDEHTHDVDDNADDGAHLNGPTHELLSEIKRAATPAAAYLQCARFAVDAGVPIVARKCLELAGNALQDVSDAPIPHMAELLVLRARVLLSTLNGDVSVIPGSGFEPPLWSSTRSNAPHPLRVSFTDSAQPVPIGSTAVAYDGALLSLNEAETALLRAAELDPNCVDAWTTLAQLQWARAATWPAAAADEQPRNTADAVTLCPLADPLPFGVPDSAELSLQQSAEIVRVLELASAAAEEQERVTRPFTIMAEMETSACASLQSLDPLLYTRAGIGGARLSSTDDDDAVRLQLRLGECLLRAAALYDRASDEENAALFLARAHAAFARAAVAAYSSSSSTYTNSGCGGSGGTLEDITRLSSGAAGPRHWAASLSGLGRTALGARDSTRARLLLEAANQRDNTDGETWAWLAHTCMLATAPRIHEAQAAAQQALRLGLCGDTASHTELLHRLGMAFGEVGVTSQMFMLLKAATSTSAVSSSTSSASATAGGAFVRGGTHGAARDGARASLAEQLEKHGMAPIA